MLKCPPEPWNRTAICLLFVDILGIGSNVLLTVDQSGKIDRLASRMTNEAVKVGQGKRNENTKKCLYANATPTVGSCGAVSISGSRNFLLLQDSIPGLGIRALCKILTKLFYF